MRRYTATLLVLLAACLSGCAGLALDAPAGRRIAVRRGGAVRMLEAFDLVPVVQCLKLPSMDAVEACMDTISPWLEITDEGELSFSPNAVNGFIGGSVGVIGTLISTMIKSGEVKDRLKCTYCGGTGQILCGHCLGTGTLSHKTDSGVMNPYACDNCESSGTVVCINCQGSGLSVPDEFLQVLGDEEVGFTESDYIGLFDANKPTASPPPPPPPDPAPAAVAQQPVSSSAPVPGSRPEDFTGGLG